MARKQFQVRIDEETDGLINLYQMLIQAKTGMFVNVGDINRAIIEKGIKTLIAENGGVEDVSKVVSEYFDKKN